MNKSRWSKMTAEQKKEYYAKRKARKAAKKARSAGGNAPAPQEQGAKAKPAHTKKKAAKKPVKKIDASKIAPKAKAIDEKDFVSFAEMSVVDALKTAFLTQKAIEGAVSEIAKCLLTLIRKCLPDVDFINVTFKDGNMKAAYGKNGK